MPSMTVGESLSKGSSALAPIFGLIGLCVTALLYRLPHLINASATQSDAAIVAIQARHWLERGEWQWYLWGVSYQSSLDVALVAFAFRLFGDSPTVLMSVPLAGHLLVIAFCYDILQRRLGVGKAFWSSLILSLAPQPVNIVALYVPRQGTITLLFAALWLLDKSDGWRRTGPALATGVALAVSCLYFDLFTVLFLPAWIVFAFSLVWEPEAAKGGRVVRSLLACLTGGAIGAGIVWLAWQDPHASTRQAGVSFSRVSENARILFDECLPWTLSARIFTADGGRYFLPMKVGPIFRTVQILGATLLATAIGFGGLSIAAKGIPWSVRRLGGLGFLTALTTSVGFLGSTLPTDVSTARYLAPIVWTAPFAIAPAASRLKTRWFALLLIPYLISSATAGWTARRDFARGLRPVLSARGSLREETELIEGLESSGVSAAKADYWIAYRLDYLFRERVIFTPLSAVENRYAPYAHAFDVEPLVAFVFHPSEPREKAETYERSFRDARIPFERRRIGGFTVLILNTATYAYADPDGEGLLTMVDIGEGERPGSRRIGVSLKRGGLEWRGVGLRDPIRHSWPFRSAIRCPLTGPGGTFRLEGTLSSEWLATGRGTLTGPSDLKPKPWRLRFRDRALPTDSDPRSKPAGAGFRGEVGDHLVERLFDGSLPVRAEPTAEVVAKESESHPSRIVDDRAQARFVERAGDVLGRSSLSAVAGNEEPNARHRLAKLGELSGISRADDRAEQAVTRRPSIASRPFRHLRRDMTIDRPPFGDQILKVSGRGVAGAHQREHPLVLDPRDLNEGIDAVSTEIRIDRQRVGLPDALGDAAEVDLAQIGLRIGLSRRADIVAFAVENHDQALFSGIFHGIAQSFHALWPQPLIESGLKLDRGDLARDDVDHASPEFAEPLGRRGSGRVLALTNRLGQGFQPRVDPDQRRRSGRANLFDQPFREMHGLPRLESLRSVLFGLTDDTQTLQYHDPRRQTESTGPGRSAVWLARLTGGQEVVGSNPAAPIDIAVTLHSRRACVDPARARHPKRLAEANVLSRVVTCR